MANSFDRARSLFLQGASHNENGRHEAAVEAFKASLLLLPGRVSTLVNLGAAQLKLGCPKQALQVLDAALSQDPERVDALCHRGVACSMLGRDVEALDSLDRAMVLGESSGALHLERAKVLHRLGRHSEELTALRALLNLYPDDGQAHMLQGDALQHLGRPYDALLSYERAVDLEPRLGPAWSQRGHLLRRIGRLGEASTSYKRAIAAGDDALANGYFLSATGVGPVHAAAPLRYVRELFDHFADHFDVDLVQLLKYRGHCSVVGPIRSLGRGPYPAALDMGCGTGLAAPLLRPLVARLVGLDLSAKMIEHAHRTGCYDELTQVDLMEYLSKTQQRYDLIVCCDVFTYLGDLVPVFAAVRRVLNAGGVFGFSVEAGDAERGFELQPSLRYAHSEPYLRRIASDNDMQVLRSVRGPLREQAGQEIDGLYMHLGRI